MFLANSNQVKTNVDVQPSKHRSLSDGQFCDKIGRCSFLWGESMRLLNASKAVTSKICIPLIRHYPQLDEKIIPKLPNLELLQPVLQTSSIDQRHGEEWRSKHLRSFCGNTTVIHPIPSWRGSKRVNPIESVSGLGAG
jgi:hypothetical protein